MHSRSGCAARLAHRTWWHDLLWCELNKENATTISLVAFRLHLFVVSRIHLPHPYVSCFKRPHLFLGSFGQQTLLSGLTSSQWDLKASFCASHTAFINRLFLSAWVAIWKPVSKDQASPRLLGHRKCYKGQLKGQRRYRRCDQKQLFYGDWLKKMPYSCFNYLHPPSISNCWIWSKQRKSQQMFRCPFILSRWSNRMHSIAFTPLWIMNFQSLLSCSVSSTYQSPTTNGTFHVLFDYLQKASTAKTHLAFWLGGFSEFGPLYVFYKVQ